MQYIRHNKSQPNWDPNTTHCLYGLDADLIMLALTTHEPHFVLLRENVLVKKKKSEPPEFHYLHLCMVREYLQLEFQALKPLLKAFAYDLENIIDDIVLMCFFIGNDFLPSLPRQDIAENSLNQFMKLYKDLLPKLTGYLTTAGQINFDRFDIFMKGIAEIERGAFGFEDIGSTNIFGLDENAQPQMTEEQIQREKRFLADLAKLGIDPTKQATENNNNNNASDGKNEEELHKSQELQFKADYYDEKFPVQSKNDAQFRNKVTRSYIEGLVWVLNYYHHGCISWGWFYPYYYAPLAAGLCLFCVWV